MQILVISGFLGSGKTSILMPFVKQLSAKGKKVAIIEN
jgi:G3E family GTPase